MKKVNVSLPNKQWGTIKTKYPNSSALVSYDELTNDSKNFDTTVKGVITKRSGGVEYNPISFSTPPKDQYEAIFNDGAHHLLEVNNGDLRFSSGGGVFTLVTSGYSALGNFEFAMNQDRVYFDNGIDAPQVYDRTTSYGGVSYTAPQTKIMGAQAPVSAPTFAADTAGGNVPAGGHTYKVTFLYYGLEESNGGPATGTHTVAGPNFTVNLTALPIGGYGVTARKIYRDNTDGVWLLVGTVNNNTATTFSDTASTGTAPIPADHNVPPSYKYIVAHLDRNWISGIPGDPFAVYFSEAGLPNVFPSRNRIQCNPSDPVTALYVYNDKVWVLNRNSLGSILGTTSDTFRYSILPSSVGCVDNRSIQIRTTTGIPTMVWLSSKGIYGTNGSSVTYLSDAIEDLVNLNIQQASQVKGQNAQTTQSQFLAGTSSPGIDLTSIPGTITTPNPRRLWDTEAAWEGGSSLTNLVTNDGSNTISVPTLQAPAFSAGSHNGTVEVSSTLRTPIGPNFTGESYGQASRPDFFTQVLNGYNKNHFAQAFIPQLTGTLNQLSGFSFNVQTQTSGTATITVNIMTDSGGLPSSVLASQAFTHACTTTPTDVVTVPTLTFNVALTGGVKYWIEFSLGQTGPSSPLWISAVSIASGHPWSVASPAQARTNAGAWATFIPPNPNTAVSLAGAYTYTKTPVSTSGIWVGPTYDSFSDSAVAATITHTGSFPASTSSVTTVEASNDPGMATPLTQTFANLNGSTAVSLSNRRYWRIKIQLITTDDRNTAVIGLPTLKFSTTGIWISEVIDHTTDVTAYNSLSIVSSLPAGTSAIVEIATSANNISYTAFTSLGSAVVQRYSKTRITLTTDAGNTDSAEVSSALLTWTVVANFQSSGIDTGNTPAGWDIFQAQFAANGGTVQFFLRTASTLGGLTAASYIAISNGQFPTNAVLQFVQWKVIITSMANTVPTIDSVTINWFISTTSSIRVASLFYNRSYYLAAAEYNQTTNNLMIVWDGEGNWRIYRGITANTMGFFFNDPYYGSSIVGKFIKFLQSTTDQGTPIEMIVDTKSIDFEDSEHTKILRKLYLSGHNTGAAFQVSFSLDGGTTFYLMIDETTGLTTFTTSTSGTSFYRRFIPNFELGQPTAGKEILFRIREATSAEVSFDGLKAEVWIRSGELVQNADLP